MSKDQEMPQTRAACYAEISRVMKHGVSDYYRRHPALLGDDRSLEAIGESMVGLNAIYAVLDQYDIKRKPIPSSGGAK